MVKLMGLCFYFSDHFLHANHRFSVILYTLFLSHSFSPYSIILGTMMHIPMNMKQSVFNSSNSRDIAKVVFSANLYICNSYYN